jgi:hypothetical protein
MRVVAGSALVVRAGLTLWSDPPPVNVTIPAILLIGAGILLITGLWTAVAGRSIALTEIWRCSCTRRQVAVAGDGNRWCRPGNVWDRIYGLSTLAFMAGSASTVHAARRTLTVIKRFSTYQISCLRRGSHSFPQVFVNCPDVGSCLNEHRCTIIREFKPRRLNKEY